MINIILLCNKGLQLQTNSVAVVRLTFRSCKLIVVFLFFRTVILHRSTRHELSYKRIKRHPVSI
jgi:hypothetical protein